jgi:hypothetical protein
MKFLLIKNEFIRNKKWITENISTLNSSVYQTQLDYNTEGGNVIHFQIRCSHYIGNIKVWETGDICLIKIELPSDENETINLVAKDESEVLNLLRKIIIV